MIDLHAHILPGVDDGPDDLDGSAALAAEAVERGTRVLAATSHVNQGFGRSVAELASARAAVVARLARDRIPLEVVQGGEVSTGRLPSLDDDDLRAVTLGGGPWVLLECPFSPAAASMDLMVADLQRRGFHVLLAHPERSPSFQRQPGLLARLIAGGALSQLTAGSLEGSFGDAARRTAFAMAEQRLFHVLASDAHHHRDRPPGVEAGLAALRERFGDLGDEAAWLTVAVPEAILAGAQIPARPARRSRRRRRGPRLLRRLRA